MSPRHDAPLETILFSRERIAARVAALAAEIADSAARDGIVELAVVAVADGALVFAADLIRALPGRVHFQTVRLTSYGAGTATGGEVRLLGPAPDVVGRHVLVVEDILDTGLTLNALRGKLVAGGAASIRTVVLLDKPTGRLRPYVADHVGFTCPDAFVVGYGLDIAGVYRNLPDIGIPNRAIRAGTL